MPRLNRLISAQATALWARKATPTTRLTSGLRSAAVSAARSRMTTVAMSYLPNRGGWTTIYSGSATSKALSGKVGGSYFYRAQACADRRSSMMAARISRRPLQIRAGLGRGLPSGQRHGRRDGVSLLIVSSCALVVLALQHTSKELWCVHRGVRIPREYTEPINRIKPCIE